MPTLSWLNRPQSFMTEWLDLCLYCGCAGWEQQEKAYLAAATAAAAAAAAAANISGGGGEGAGGGSSGGQTCHAASHSDSNCNPPSCCSSGSCAEERVVGAGGEAGGGGGVRGSDMLVVSGTTAVTAAAAAAGAGAGAGASGGCGGGRKEDLQVFVPSSRLFCADCGECFHPWCTFAPIRTMDTKALAVWRCPNCKVSLSHVGRLFFFLGPHVFVLYSEISECISTSMYYTRSILFCSPCSTECLQNDCKVGFVSFFFCMI